MTNTNTVAIVLGTGYCGFEVDGVPESAIPALRRDQRLAAAVEAGDDEAVREHLVGLFGEDVQWDISSEDFRVERVPAGSRYAVVMSSADVECVLTESMVGKKWETDGCVTRRIKMQELTETA